ncbi:nucleolysin TIA-1/TIAR [Vigna unguiculata]|uniref:RING-type E3 ubiquitin transferase n=1 Tax=Vigna unguiculata TaxID=3917 RepID=A0A4D6LHG0_VIGUN|nr:nucleolysin TIA-1/TIAR [Vigna unguiculata]
MSTEATVSARTTNLDSHYILDAYETDIMHRMTEWDGHQPNLNIHVPVSSSLAIYLNPHFNASGASSSIAHHNTRHTEIGIPILPYYGFGEYMITHDSNAFILGNYLGDQHYQSIAPLWSDHPEYHVFNFQTQPVQEVRGHSINFHLPSSFSTPIQNASFASAYMQQPPPPGHRMNSSPVAFLETEVVEYFEQIGNVGTGLSEEIFTRVVKTKTFLAPNNLEGVTSDEQEIDLCVICQDEYKNQEEIGILRCRHEYHVDCIRRWLHEKNVCPICKSEVLDHE